MSSTVQYSTVQYSTEQFITVQYNIVHYITLHYITLHYITLHLPRIEPSVLLLLLLSEKLAKSSQPILESSSIQTAEPIVKCHTIL